MTTYAYDMTNQDMTLALREMFGLPATLGTAMTAVHAVTAPDARELTDALARAKRTKVPSIFLPTANPAERRAFVLDITGGGGPYIRFVHLWSSAEGGPMRLISGNVHPRESLIVGRSRLRYATINLATDADLDVGIERANRLLCEAARRHRQERLNRKAAA